MRTKILLTLLFVIQQGAFSQPAIQWQKCLGGTGSEQANSIRETTDGGYIVAGGSSSNNGDVSGNHSTLTTDYWIAKISGNGTLQWQKCLGGTGYDVAYAIEQTTDGGYIVAGYTNSTNGDVTGNHSNFYDEWIVKLDSSGIIQWQK